jgi:hypothetical protein
LNPTTLVWRTSVSPQHFTCMAVSCETWFAKHLGVGATRSMLLAWVGWESNPRRDGVRNRYKASVCYQPELPRHVHHDPIASVHITASSFPQELNLDLSGYSQVR